MTGPGNDNDLDDFLARRSPVHRRFAETDASDPPAELDRIVLAKAREAIKRPTEMPIYRAPQWAMPMGLAASLLLIFVVVLNIARVPRQSAAPEMAANIPAAVQPTAASEQARVAQEAEFATALADAKAEADAAPPPALSSRESLLAKQDVGPSAAREERTAKASSPQLAREAAPPPLASVAVRAERPVFSEAQSPVAITTIPATDDSTATASNANPTSGFIGADRALTAQSGAAVSAIPASPAPPAAPPPEPSTTSDSPPLASRNPLASTREQQAPTDTAKDVTASADTPSTASNFDEVVTTGSVRRVRGKRPNASNAPAAIEAERAKHSDPNEWLREIEALRAAGRISEANRELESFHRVYPEHTTRAPTAEPASPPQ